VAAPLSTIDLGTPTGEEIPIEQRDITEVTHIKGQRLVPPGISVANPAFDITPNKLVSAIITEKGVVKAPYQESIAALFEP
jgi:methylthioribose-1-phosphate isomerase